LHSLQWNLRFILLLFFCKSKYSIIKQSTKCIHKEFSHWHFLMLVRIFNQFQKVFKHMIIWAWFYSFNEFILALLFFLYFTYKKIYFFFENFMTRWFIFFISNLKFNFFQITLCITLEHIWKSFFTLVIPSFIFIKMFLKLNFA